MFRDALMQSLVDHLDIDTQAYRPSVVFLNGEYWGIYNLRERYDKDYFASHYNLDEDKVAMLNFPVKTSGDLDIEVVEGTENDANAFRTDIIQYLKNNDVKQTNVYEHMKTVMDIDNFINYNIANMYYINVDWPGNNTSVWKFNTPSENMIRMQKRPGWKMALDLKGYRFLDLME